MPLTFTSGACVGDEVGNSVGVSVDDVVGDDVGACVGDAAALSRSMAIRMIVRDGDVREIQPHCCIDVVCKAASVSTIRRQH